MENTNLISSKPNQLLVFVWGEARYALFLSAVKKVIQAVEIMELPEASRYILGVINVQGDILPVIDIRACFGLPESEIRLNTHFILAKTGDHIVALVVDEVMGIHELKGSQLVEVEHVAPGAKYIRGLAKLEDDLVLICDLDQFLTNDELEALDDILTESEPESQPVPTEEREGD
jgi:purine-binding chemotaxis protein CheW